MYSAESVVRLPGVRKEWYEMHGRMGCGLGLELMRVLMGDHGPSAGVKEVGVDLGWRRSGSCGERRCGISRH